MHGLIGADNMGLPLAQHSPQADHSPSVFNRTVARADSLGGATRAATPWSLAEQHGIVLSILADNAALRAIPLGVLAGLAPGNSRFDMSTVSPDIGQELDRHYRTKGMHSIAAPVFCRPEAAAKRWICPACSPDAIERCQPLWLPTCTCAETSRLGRIEYGAPKISGLGVSRFLSRP